jgi:hypothetical protein
MRTLGKIAVVPTIASGLIAAGATAAHASTTNGHYNTNGARIRSCPFTNCTVNGEGQRGQAAHIFSFTFSGTDAGHSGGLWFNARDQKTGVRGWTYGSLISS